jgi:hypothetical protein
MFGLHLNMDLSLKIMSVQKAFLKSIFFLKSHKSINNPHNKSQNGFFFNNRVL